jgi:hypothetical protein
MVERANRRWLTAAPGVGRACRGTRRRVEGGGSTNRVRSNPGVGLRGLLRRTASYTGRGLTGGMKGKWRLRHPCRNLNPDLCPSDEDRDEDGDEDR